MIARIWRGRTRESDQNTYFEYLQRTGLKDYASILAIAVSGCCGVFMKVRRSSRSYRCGIHGMRSKPLLVLSMKRRSIIPKTRNFCWNSIRTSRTTRFCSPAEARRIGGDNLPPATSAFPQWKRTSGSPWFPPTWLAHRDAPVRLSCSARALRSRRSESRSSSSSQTRTARR